MTDPSEDRPVRIFLDSGVFIQGCLIPWGGAKAILILATLRERYTVVLAEAVEQEVHRAIEDRIASVGVVSARAVAESVAGWMSRVRIERHARPSAQDLRSLRSTLLPVVRHANDLPAIVTAASARPDWVISANREHWNDRVAARTGLRIVTPIDFLRHLRLPTE